MLPISRSPQSSKVGVSGDMITALALSPDGSNLAWGTVAGSYVFLSPVHPHDTSERCRKRFFGGSGGLSGGPIEHGGIRSLNFRQDGQGIVAMTTEGYLFACPLTDEGWKNPEIYFPGERTSSGVVSFTSDNLFAVGFNNGTVNLLEMMGSLSHGQTRRVETHTLEGHEELVRVLAVSPDGRLLASGSDDRTVRIWDIESRRCRHVLRGHAGWVRSLAFSPDGRLLASGSDDQTVLLWNLEQEDWLLRFRHQPHLSQQPPEDKLRTTFALAFLHVGEVLAAAHTDGTISLYDLVNDEQLDLLERHDGWVTAMAWLGSGSLLWSAGRDGCLRRWDMSDI